MVMQDPPGEPPPTPRARSRTGLVAAIVVTCLVGAAVAGAVILGGGGTPAEAQVFSYAFARDETRTYSFEMRADIDAPEGFGAPGAVAQSMRGTLVLRVVDVDEDGTATIEMAFSDEQSGSTVTERIRVSRDGQVLSGSGSLPFGFGSGPPGAAPGALSPADGAELGLFPSFPPDAVGPGDTWERSYTFPSPAGAGTMVTVAGAHEGFEDTAFGRAARMRQTSKLPLEFSFPVGSLFGGFARAFQDAFPDGSRPSPAVPDVASAAISMTGQLASTGTMLVLPDDGELIEAHSEIEMDMRIDFTGFPDDAQGQVPSASTVRATMKMDVVRTS